MRGGGWGGRFSLEGGEEGCDSRLGGNLKVDAYDWRTVRSERRKGRGGRCGVGRGQTDSGSRE